MLAQLVYKNALWLSAWWELFSVGFAGFVFLKHNSNETDLEERKKDFVTKIKKTQTVREFFKLLILHKMYFIILVYFYFLAKLVKLYMPW